MKLSLYIPTGTTHEFAGLPDASAALSTLDVTSGGRFTFGIGAGWYEDEYTAFGYDFPSGPERLRQLDEALRIIRSLWTEPTTSRFRSAGPGWRTCGRPRPAGPARCTGRRHLAEYGLTGTVDTIRKRLAAYEAAGVDELLVGFHDALDPGTIRRFAAEFIQ